MDNYDIPPAVQHMSELSTATLKNVNDIRNLLTDAVAQYMSSEESRDKQKRVDGRRMLFLHLTTIHRAHREIIDALQIQIVNELYESMSEELGK
jgi:hypothetical protein